MAYLKKHERQDAILQAAIAIMREHGISALTARAIAKQAGIAVGQIHHHFDSVNQIKAQALLQVTDILLNEAEDIIPNATALSEHIINLVAPLPGQEGVDIRKLWNEAVYLAEYDADIKAAYQSSTIQWHSMLVELILQQVGIGEQTAVDLSWQLIALSNGLDNLSIINNEYLNAQFIRTQLQTALQQAGFDAPPHEANHHVWQQDKHKSSAHLGFPPWHYGEYETRGFAPPRDFGQ